MQLPVHKIFLEAGSPVLDGKIKPETEEIKIENVDTRVFKMLLKVKLLNIILPQVQHQLNIGGIHYEFASLATLPKNRWKISKKIWHGGKLVQIQGLHLIRISLVGYYFLLDFSTCTLGSRASGWATRSN